MNINWKVRVANPLFWLQVVASIVLPLVAGVGLEWNDMTSWSTLGNTLCLAISNPVVVVGMLVGLYNTIMDPTTKGFGDSAQAMTYEKPAGYEAKHSKED